MSTRSLAPLVVVPFIGLLFAGGNTRSARSDRPRPDVDLGPAQEKTWVAARKQERFEARLDSLPPDSAQPEARSYQAALEAAKVDPGILLFPDTTVEAKIRIITPPSQVDPGMIRPEQDPQGDGR